MVGSRQEVVLGAAAGAGGKRAFRPLFLAGGTVVPASAGDLLQ